jgi:hypothetical protein
MNSFFFQAVYWACECNAKELSVYNEIKMKRVREVYALLAKKGKPIFSGCFDHND